MTHDIYNKKDRIDDDADDDVMIVGIMVISIRRRWRLKSSLFSIWNLLSEIIKHLSVFSL